MTTRWLNTSGGEAPYYKDGDYIYSKEGKCKFSVSAGWWHDIKTGKPAFYVADNWVYSAEGKPIIISDDPRLGLNAKSKG